MNTIVEQLKSTLSPEMIDTVSQALDEPKDNVTKGLDGLFPILVGGIIKKQEDEPTCGIIEHLTNLLKEQALWDGGSITTDYVGIRNILMGEGEQAHQSARFITLIFGERIEELTGSIANYAGLKIGSAYSLIILAGTLAIAVLTKNAFDNNFLPTTLLKSLQAQRNHIFAATPLSLLSILDLDKHETLATKAEDIAADIRKNNIVKIIILILALLIIAFLLLRSCTSSDHHNKVHRPASNSGQKINQGSWGKLGQMKEVNLPNGTRIRVPERGIENRLLAFIQHPRKLASHSPWFAFDRLQFNTGSAVLSPSSNAQLACIGQILKAYPNVYILVGGFTDDTGSKEVNNPLSIKRAQAVKNHLVSQGVNSSRIEIRGYGQAHPIKSNRTEEGRAENRRAGIRVLKK